jgi:hypothetical protein
MNKAHFEYFIEIVRENALLWDKTHEDYKDRIKCLTAWSEIAAQFNIGILRWKFINLKKTIICRR